jgi:glycosidase
MPDLQILQISLTELYGEKAGSACFTSLAALIERYALAGTSPAKLERSQITQHDSILITYVDQVLEAGTPPLRRLAVFCEQHLKSLVGGVHLLPFYPSSSDDGFSVIDYQWVDPTLGSWQDVSALGRSFRLMFDAVINHVSAQSEWFKAFLRGDAAYSRYFIEITAQPDLSKVVRPRALPLLTSFDTASGLKRVWTTFSVDQVDLNYSSPDVLLEIIDTLLFYAAHGAQFIRLDAIAYLWKEIGTSCIHLPQTHRVIQLIRQVLDLTYPEVLLITETNVLHADNISYFGDGTNEAQLVYNFALPPLVLHSLYTGSAVALSAWAKTLKLPCKNTAFFNFLASHDGIGLNPARGILSDGEIDSLVKKVQAHGGLVSYKNNPDGSQSPYELNINYFDALSDPRADEPLDLQIDRFIVSQAIMLALAGMPGIYFHSLFGSRSWPEGVQITGRNRTINRQKLDAALLESELHDPGSLRSRVFTRFTHLLKARAGSAAFHPNGEQHILECGCAIFALLRISPDQKEAALCLHNLSDQTQIVNVIHPSFSGETDLVSGSRIKLQPDQPITLQPYQVVWLA